ncbi:MAG: phosphoribosylformylglycinamidine cyclo-ligase [Candidatus Brockarchaeota archaeon]|nr:phosphoribosylformylglycinamidine cyclo-ligase [Candidatus Brockarchaeota archaeon]MBO3808724.1 phosphoribosylformylglycinamidine cyclo-ligase [Candidatus Brockarchaeota archaeon]
MASRYEELGVDVSKKGVEFLKRITDDVFPEAFSPVVKDSLNPGWGIILHTDGAGTKPVVSYVYYKETGEEKFETLADDVVAMNVDDAACVGGVPAAFSDYVAVNPFKVPKQELLKSLAKGFSRVFSMLREKGVEVFFSGGETADLPDIVRTFDVSGTVMAKVELSKVITGRNVSPGDVIIGLRSGGRSTYEEKENSGIMCNGITLARHCLLAKEYLDKYPEIGSEAKGYYGRFKIDSFVDELNTSIGEALLSPTRIYLPIILEVMKSVKVKAMIHNTGGGLTKCLKIGRNIRYVKDNLPEPDPIFRLIQVESRETLRNMYRSFNMGIGLEIIVEKKYEDTVADISEKFHVGAQTIGKCEKSSGGNSLIIISKDGKFEYRV